LGSRAVAMSFSLREGDKVEGITTIEGALSEHDFPS